MRGGQRVARAELRGQLLFEALLIVSFGVTQRRRGRRPAEGGDRERLPRGVVLRAAAGGEVAVGQGVRGGAGRELRGGQLVALHRQGVDFVEGEVGGDDGIGDGGGDGQRLRRLAEQRGVETRGAGELQARLLAHRAHAGG